MRRGFLLGLLGLLACAPPPPAPNPMQEQLEKLIIRVEALQAGYEGGPQNDTRMQGQFFGKIRFLEESVKQLEARVEALEAKKR